MKQADLTIGKAYALGRYGRGRVVLVEKGLYNPHTLRKDRVRVRRESGEIYTVESRDIIRPWAEEEKARAEAKARKDKRDAERRETDEIASRLGDALGLAGIQTRKGVLRYGDTEINLTLSQADAEALIARLID